MVSLLYKAQIPIALTFTRPRVPAKNPDGTARYDEKNQRVYEPGSGEPETLEVHLTLDAVANETERQGLDTNTVRYTGQVVKTPPGKPLELPEGVNQFPLTVRGQAGTLTISPTEVPQHKTERKKLGAEFLAVWNG